MTTPRQISILALFVLTLFTPGKKLGWFRRDVDAPQPRPSDL